MVWLVALVYCIIVVFMPIANNNQELFYSASLSFPIISLHLCTALKSIQRSKCRSTEGERYAKSKES